MAKATIVVANFEDAEDTAGFHEVIAGLAAIAGETAFSEARALKLPKVFANEQAVILLQPDGSRKVISTAVEEKHGAYFQRFPLEQCQK